MIVSVGSCSGLPSFRQIKQVVALNTEILFVCNEMTCMWYHEHLRSFELICDNNNPFLCVVQMKELNDVFPLSGYRYGDNLVVTLRALYSVLRSHSVISTINLGCNGTFCSLF